MHIKMCPRGAQTCELPLFCDCKIKINAMTLKLEGDLHILKMYLHTENEAQNIELELKNMKISLEVKGQGQNVKSSKVL